MRDPWKKLLSNVKSTAAVRPKRRTVNSNGTAKIPYAPMSVDITAEDLKTLFEDQGGRCAILNTPLDPQDLFVKRHPLAPSVDRIDNDQNYNIDNIQICSRFANFGKCAYPSEDMGEVVSRIREGFSSKWWQFWK
jgi:hypothetical protein|tara:strand:+ start:42 stop:446 length:405 start_codon:yes stop_codon:yes gene_type:complete